MLPLFGLVHHTLSLSHCFFFEPSPRFSRLPRLWPLVTCSLISSCAQPVHLPSPPFFPMGIRNFEGSPNQARSSRLSTLAPPFIGICDPALPLFPLLPLPSPSLPSSLLSSPLPFSPSITRPACISPTPDPFTKYPSSPILEYLAPSSISGTAVSALRLTSCCVVPHLW